MLKLWVLNFLVALASVAAAQTQSEPILKTPGQPTYPPLARQARIQGQVKLEFVVNQNGEPVSVTTISGHPMLAPAAEAEVWAWRFKMPKRDSPDDFHLETTFDYALVDFAPNYSDSSPLPVVFDSFHHVTVSALPMMVDHGGGDNAGILVCPTESDRATRTSESAEFLELIGAECYGAAKNPGTTPLMYAAGQSQTDKVKRLLHNGAAVVDTDAKGWIALMYAAATNSDDSINILLAKGANPNQASLLGNSPLMLAASGGYARDSIGRLLGAGANINAQNNAGTTLLMILAAKAVSDAVDGALDDGADPMFRDKMNRTALDYLHLANCGKSPIREAPKEAKTVPGKATCDELNQKDVVTIERLLAKAMRHAQSR